MTNPAYEALAEKTLQFLPNPCRLGLGSGRTTSVFIRRLAAEVKNGLQVVAVPTSEVSAELALSLEIPIRGLQSADQLDVTIDGADEVEESTLNVIKGCGGALVRERIVAAASKKQILIVTEEKLVSRLGQRDSIPLPVEVLPFAAQYCMDRIHQLHLSQPIQPGLRGDGEPVVTDNGNWIIDCQIGTIDDPAALHRELRAIPGVIDTGLFLGTASMILVARGDRVEVLQRRGT